MDTQERTATALVLVVRYEDIVRPDTGTIGDLAEVLRHRAYGHVDIEVIRVQALDEHNELVEVDWRVEGAGEYDDDDFAHPKVTITFPDGREESAYYRVDGAA